MAGSMDSYRTKKGTDVTDRLKRAVSDAERVGEDFKNVKDHMQIPEGIDDDLKSLMADVEKTAKAEALKDIEVIKSTDIASANTAGDEIRSDVSTKIADNMTAKGKLEGITSKYGKDAITKAKTAIDGNTKMGEDLLSDMEKELKDAKDKVQQIKDSL